MEALEWFLFIGQPRNNMYIEDEIVVVQSHALWPVYWKGTEVRFLRNHYDHKLPKVGDVVVVDTPTGAWLRFVVGLPHDIVDLDDRFDPAVLKVNGLIACNYNQKKYIIGKDLFRFIFSKLSVRISDGYCLVLPTDYKLYKRRFPFGLVPIDSVAGGIVSMEDKVPLGMGGENDFFDSSDRMGLQLRD